MTKQHHYQQLIDVFNQCFENTENTILVAGEDEPYYCPAGQQHAHHRVVFAHGFYASALHEISHWCIAGRVRRQILIMVIGTNPTAAMRGSSRHLNR